MPAVTRWRGELEIVAAVLRESAEQREAGQVLVAVLEPDRQFGVADALRERRGGPVAIPIRVIVRRVCAARVVAVLVQPGRRPHQTPARQTQVLAVGAELQVERAFAQRPAQAGGRVALRVLVVVAVAVRGVAVERRVDADGVVGKAAVELSLVGVEAGGAAVGLERGAALERRAADDVDHARRGTVAVQHRARAAQDLDALDVRQGNRRPLDVRQIEVV
jgi:hypothetical protein